jgi:hypothetical protein
MSESAMEIKTVEYPEKISLEVLRGLRNIYRAENAEKIQAEEKKQAEQKLVMDEQCKQMEVKYAANISKFIVIINNELKKQARAGKRYVAIYSSFKVLNLDKIPREDMLHYNMALIRVCEKYFDVYRINDIVVNPDNIYYIDMAWE